jgi:hypothetical protein
MAKPTREQAYEALWTLVQTVHPPGGYNQWRTKSRRLALWDNVPPASQPALFLHKGIETVNQPQAYGAIQYSWQSQIWIYFRSDTLPQGILPDSEINNFLDAFDLVLQGLPPGERQTLGGVIYQCFIDGVIAFDDGLVDNQAVIIIPITMLTGM